MRFDEMSDQLLPVKRLEHTCRIPAKELLPGQGQPGGTKMRPSRSTRFPAGAKEKIWQTR